jgi:transcription elongation GreA/GreB family factor
MRTKISELHNKVKALAESSSQAADKSWLAANEVSGGLISSYSAAGDAEHSRNSANLSLQKAAAIKKLMTELEESRHLNIQEIIKPVCFVSVEFSDGNRKDLYLVKNPVFIMGHNLISPSSPLGEALVGKRSGDLFLYTSGGQSFSGKILEVE